MQFKVMSRRDCVKYSYGSHEESSVVISINDSAEMGVRQLPNKFNNIKAQLSLFFDDIQPYKGMQYWKKDEGSIVENFTNSDCSSKYFYIIFKYIIAISIEACFLV